MGEKKEERGREKSKGKGRRPGHHGIFSILFLSL